MPEGISPEEGYNRLLTVGGFPEPFLKNDKRQARRWRRERFSRILNEDIRDISKIQQTQLLTLLVDALKQRVGGLVVYASLAEDLQVSPKTIKSWISLISDMYIAFPIYPLTKNIPRSILKPAKVFFYDNADCNNGEGAQLENLVATHLLKRLHYIEDYEGYDCSLHYIRDKSGREVDFVTIIDGAVHDLIEVKLTDKKISPSLQYYSTHLNPKRTTQIVGTLQQPFEKNGIRVTNPILFFQQPPWEKEAL